MQVVYEIPQIELIKTTILNPLVLAILGFSALTGVALVLAIGGMPTWRAVALVILITLNVVIVTILLLPKAYYGVENGYIVISAIGKYKIPITAANITLVPYEKVKPVFRIAGVSLPDVHIGKFRFANGKYGVALVYKPDSEAIVIMDSNRIYVISHRDVREYYYKLLELTGQGNK